MFRFMNLFFIYILFNFFTFIYTRFHLIDFQVNQNYIASGHAPKQATSGLSNDNLI